MKQSKYSKNYIFFDQNIMNKMSKKNYYAFQTNVNTLVSQNSNKIYQIFTPFGLLEFAGFRKEEIFYVKYKNKMLSEYPFLSIQEICKNEFRAILKEQIHKKIPKLFLKEKLEEKTSRESSYLNQRGLRYINKYVNSIDTLYNDLMTNLFLDRISQINISQFSSEDKQQFVTFSTQLVMNIICQRRVMGSFRLICRIAQEIRRDPEHKKSMKQTPELLDTLQKMNIIIEKLKPHGDLVDCELIHLAFFGSNNHHCHCYTTDNEKTIKERLKFYCVYINFFIKLFFDYTALKGKPPSHIANQYNRPEWRCGKLFILDRKTGEKITKIPISKIYKEISTIQW